MPYSTSFGDRPVARLRGVAWLTLTDTGYVLRGSITDDAGGGAASTWGTATVWGTATGVPCRIDPIGGARGETAFGGQIDDRSTHRLTMPAGAAVDVADRVAVAGRGTFEVTAIRTRTGEWARVVELVGT